MEKFCIITNNEKDKNYEISNKIKAYLIKQNKQCVIAKEAEIRTTEYDPYTDVSVIPDDTDLAIVLGGDGTMIQAANDLVHKDIPLLGINLGTLGFLAEVDKNYVAPIFERLFRNEYSIENRMMLKGNIQIQGGERYQGYALNDILITKRGLCRIITVKVYVNDELIDTYQCDGVVVATPTGSTGYNLSAGGPVVVPGIQAMMITAICPHTLNNRCIMVSAQDTVVLELGKSKNTQLDEAAAIYDGRLVEMMTSGDRITIKRAEETTKLVKVTDTSFFEILRTKILQGRES